MAAPPAPPHPKNKVPLAQRAREWQGHLRYLHSLAKEDPGSAWSHWRDSYQEQAALKDAVGSLVARAKSESFDWQEIPRVLGQFHLKADDAGQAEWYGEASRQYQTALTRLEKEPFKPALVEPLLKELRFIAEADVFHQKFGLTDLQIRIKTMYQALLQRIDQHNLLLKEATAVKIKHAEVEKLRAQEAIATAEAEKVAQQNRLVQQERQKAVEEKQLLNAKQAAEEASVTRQAQERELAAQDAERRRREDLENSMRNLAQQEEMRNGSLQQQIDWLLKNLQSAEKLSGEDFAATARLFDVLRKKFAP